MENIISRELIRNKRIVAGFYALLFYSQRFVQPLDMRQSLNQRRFVLAILHSQDIMRSTKTTTEPMAEGMDLTFCSFFADTHLWTLTLIRS